LAAAAAAIAEVIYQPPPHPQEMVELVTFQVAAVVVEAVRHAAQEPLAVPRLQRLLF
jgi:hypothetical protein